MLDSLVQHYEKEWQEKFNFTLAPNSWLHQFRKSQWNSFVKQGFPTRHNEQWKYSDLSTFKQNSYALSVINRHALEKHQLSTWLCSTDNCLVFIDGFFAPSLSQLNASNTPGVIMASLSEAFTRHEDLLFPYLEENKIDTAFYHLNSACMQDGAFIYLPADFILRKPLQILHLTTKAATGSLLNIRNIIILNSNAKATLLEEHQSFADINYAANSTTQVLVDEGAHLNYIKLQNQNKVSTHIGHTILTQKRNSKVIAGNYSFGCKFAREDIHCMLEGDGAQLDLQGMYLPFDQQHLDIHTYVYNRANNASSEQSFKGIVASKSRAVFNGKIVVEEQTRGTVANLQNKNLLLAKDCEVNTKPELEIYSKDVKCRHGATVGQIDQEMLFYLRSRGISKEKAHQLLLLAFLHENLYFIEHEEISEKIKQLVSYNCELKGYE